MLVIMKIERQENSVMGGGSSESSENSGCGLFRRRAMGGGMALSWKGKENNLLLAGFRAVVPLRLELI